MLPSNVATLRLDGASRRPDQGVLLDVATLTVWVNGERKGGWRAGRPCCATCNFGIVGPHNAKPL